MPVNRDNLLAGAALLLDEAGTYDGLTIDALASNLKMSKSTLYKHFESKDRLVAALVDSLIAVTDQDLSRAVPRQASPAEALAAWFQAYGRFVDRIPRAVLLQPEKLPRACRARLDDLRDKFAASLLEVAERGAAAGAFRVTSGCAAGRAIAAGLDAAVLAGARGEIPGTRGDVVRGLQVMYAAGMGLPVGAVAV